jgi:tRNA1(Val) A37 N6-methylase TrmN6
MNSSLFPFQDYDFVDSCLNVASTPPSTACALLDFIGSFTALSKANSFLDLGCGDGRLVILAAQRNIKSVGKYA